MQDTEPTTTFESVIEADLATLDFGIAQKAIAAQSGAMSYREAHELYLAALKEEVDKAPTITDRKTREQVQRIRTRLVSIRTGLDERRKALFAPMRALKEQVDAYIGTGKDSGLQARVKALEQVLEAKEAAWDQEQERIRQEALRIQQERSAARWRELEALGFRFIQPGIYVLGEPAHPLHLSKPQAEVDAMNEEAWEVFLRGARHNAGELAKEKQAEDWYNAYLAAGATVDTTTGLAAYTLLDGREIAVLHETLHGISKDAVDAEIALIVEDVAARKRAKEEEHEAMRRKFEEQAAKQRQMDEDRERLDRERAALKEEKQAARHERLIALGAERDERGFYHVGGDLCQVVGNLADMREEDWQMALEAVPRAKAKWDAIQAEKQRIAELVNERGKTLVMRGAERDEAGVWTLGDATITDKLMGEMNAEAWNKRLNEFEDEEERLAIESKQHLTVAETTTGHVDTAELLACALALLDEANKCQTIAADDLDDDECEQMCVKVVAHASDCVKLVRELQEKRKP